ncbi:unnamed protein product [Adineta steineri]|uniref:Cyclic nucleotide-binding domain-containing protein n=1 Tax=Adineta steineri TaxID=433720 RepID=A0A819CXV7_9BILA|nr:unnamed protein product [Adineta steineri]
MLTSALSNPMTGNFYRDKAKQPKASRSKSQPIHESRISFLPPISTSPVRPTKSFFENLLHLKPYGSLSTAGAMDNRTRVSAYGTTIISDRSSRAKMGHHSVVSGYSAHSTNDHMPHDARPLPTRLTLKFRRAGDLILFAIHWCNFARKKNQLRSMEYQSYLQTNDTPDKRMFDKTNFKIQTLDILPVVQEFFKQPTGERNLDNADQVRRCLADVKPFSRLPKVFQDQLLQKAWYECYPEQRTIIRQGERPAYFYIVLSGSAIPTFKRESDGSVETLDVLKRGCTFGDQSLLNDSKQYYTVMSKTKLELLVLWKNDFKSIFATRDRHCSKADLRYLKNHISFLRGFPLDRLNEIPNGIQHHHFGLSEIIARDSRRMKHIFIVKKGSLDVWKRLDPVDNNQDLTKSTLERLENEKIFDDQNDLTGDSRALFSDIRLGADSSGSLANALDGATRSNHSLGEDQRAASAVSTTSRSIINEDKKFPGLIDKRDRIQLIDYEALSINSTGTKLTLTNALLKQNQSANKETVRRKLAHPDKRIYVHVKTLNEGQHFGLTDMLFPNQPALTVISNECECFLLDKASFTQFVTDQYKKVVRRTETPFPNDVAFDEKYHKNEVWRRYSKKLYLETLDRLNQRHPETIKSSVNINEPKHYQHRQSILIDAI